MITNRLHTLENICDYYTLYIIELKPNLWHSMVQKYHSSNALEYLNHKMCIYNFLIIPYHFQYVFK